MPRSTPPLCPCQSGKPFEHCCGPYLRGTTLPPTAEALMRSRYTAYVRLDEPYLQASWHRSTRPQALELTEPDAPKWIGLQIRSRKQAGPDAATIEFVARYRIGGRAYRLHETSRFVHENDRWFYVDGQIHAD